MPSTIQCFLFKVDGNFTMAQDRKPFRIKEHAFNNIEIDDVVNVLISSEVMFYISKDK